MRTASIILLTLLCGLLSRGVGAAETPNILFILADDMGWQDTSVPFTGQPTELNRRFRTPALRRLAREGMKFTDAYSCAVCSPTRVSLLTGLNQARHGVTNWTYLSGESPSSDLNHPRLEPAGRDWTERPLVWHFPNFWGPLQRPAPVSGPGMGPCSTIRKGDWKLIYYHDGPRVELFHLERDLGETENVAAEHPDHARRLAAELGEYLRQRDAVMPMVSATGRPVPWPDEYVASHGRNP